MECKEELSNEINDALGTDIDWAWMNEEDLIELKEKVDSGELLQELIKHTVKQEGRERVDQIIEEIADNYYPGKYITERLL